MQGNELEVCHSLHCRENDNSSVAQLTTAVSGAYDFACAACFECARKEISTDLQPTGESRFPLREQRITNIVSTIATKSLFVFIFMPKYNDAKRTVTFLGLVGVWVGIAYRTPTFWHELVTRPARQ